MIIGWYVGSFCTIFTARFVARSGIKVKAQTVLFAPFELIVHYLQQNTFCNASLHVEIEIRPADSRGEKRRRKDKADPVSPELSSLSIGNNVFCIQRPLQYSSTGRPPFM